MLYACKGNKMQCALLVAKCEMAARLLCTGIQEFESCSFHMLKIIKSAAN